MKKTILTAFMIVITAFAVSGCGFIDGLFNSSGSSSSKCKQDCPKNQKDANGCCCWTDCDKDDKKPNGCCKDDVG